MTAAVPPELAELDVTVQRLVDDHRAWRRRARAAEQRVRELETTLRDVSAGNLDPEVLAARIQALEEENRSLRQRVDLAREGARRVLGRLQFLEDDR